MDENNNWSFSGGIAPKFWFGVTVIPSSTGGWLNYRDPEPKVGTIRGLEWRENDMFYRTGWYYTVRWNRGRDIAVLESELEALPKHV